MPLFDNAAAPLSARSFAPCRGYITTSYVTL